MSWWSRFLWWKNRPTRIRPDVHLILYTRSGCHLCDAAWQLLERYQSRYKFRLQAVDVEGDQELVRQHGSWVPVVTVNGKVRFRGAVNEMLLKRLLEASN
jgi:glutaredoxin